MQSEDEEVCFVQANPVPVFHADCGNRGLWENDNLAPLLVVVAASVSPPIEVLSVVFSTVGSCTTLRFQPS